MADVFVLSCIDPRFTAYLAAFLKDVKGVKYNYDLVNLAGASLGANQTTFKGWKKVLTDHIDIAIKLHDIKDFWVFDHMDCGMYKAVYDLKKDDDVEKHIIEIERLRLFINENYPQLNFKGFVMDIKGGIHPIK